MQELFYDKAKSLDALKEEKHPQKEQIEEVLSALQNESLRRYFFYELNNPAWVVPLKDKGVLVSPPEPIKLEKGLVRYPSWEAGEYLARVSQHCPKEVVEIISDLSDRENISAQTNLVDAAVNIPATYSAKIVPILIKWLKQGYHFYLYHRAGELVIKLAKEKKWKAAMELFLVLLEQSKEQHEIHETLKKLVKTTAETQLFKALDLLEKSIHQIIIKSKKDEHGYIWRPSIEDHQQNVASYDTKDLLISSTRDILKKCVKEDADKSRLRLEKYLKDKYKMYWRLAINTITQCPEELKDLIFPILNDEKYLYEGEVHHEYFELIKTGFPLLPDDEKKVFVDLIKRGPKKEIDEHYKQCWIRDRLWIIQEHLNADLKKKLSKIVDIYEEPEHPEFRTYMRSWVGPESPMTKEELEKFTTEQLIALLIEWKPKEKHFAPSPEGLARDLETIVSENPSEYVEKTESFLDDRMRPVYCFYFLWGLRSAVGKGKGFPWEPVLTFCEKIIVKRSKFIAEQEQEEEENYDDVRCAVANLLQDAVSGEKSPLPIELMPRVRDILLSPTLINNPQPTLEYEAKSDPINLSINTVRGVAMHALINYAWKRAWLIEEAKKKNDTDNLNILNAEGGSLEQTVKDALNKKLDRNIEKTLTIHSIYGRYFPQLHHIDKDWATKLIPKIFPTSDNERRYWEIAWKAYVFYNRFYDQMYKLLKEHYTKAVQELDGKEVKESEESSRRLAGHFMIAYLRGLESLEDRESLLNMFLSKASDQLRSTCVWTLKGLLDAEEKGEPSDEWQKLKKYWENRVTVANSAGKPNEYQNEIGAFTLWFDKVPEELCDISELVEQTTKYVKDSTDILHLIDYICSNSDECPLEAVKILDVLVNKTTIINLQSKIDQIKIILTTCIACGGEGKNIAISIIHRFGELGSFEFKELLESHSINK